MNVYRVALGIWRVLPLRRYWQWPALWLLNTKFLVGTSAVILDDEGRVLLGRHTYRRDHPWGLLGGWLKRGEDAEEAVCREVEEESGLTVKVVGWIGTISNRRRAHLDLAFRCQVTSGTFRPSPEVDAVRYFRIDELPASLREEEREIIARAIEQEKSCTTREGNIA